MRSTHEKRVLFFLSAGWGPAVRTLPIMKRLAADGISSSLAVGGGIGPIIRAAGFDLVEFDVPPLGATAAAARDWWSPYHLLAHHNLDIDPLLAHVEAYRRAILNRKPAAVVTDLNPVAALAVRSLRVPHVAISQSLFLPGRNCASSRWTMPSALPAINRVLAHYRASILEAAEQLELGDTTLVPSFPEFDPLRNVPQCVQYVGPILGNQFVPLLASADRPAAGKAPAIFFYPGRPHDGAGPSGQALLSIGLTALSCIQVAVTVATGGWEFDIPEHAQSQVEIVPWRVISPDYKPDLVIHHGGHGACLTAISAGIPSVVIPTHAEREYNATRLAALGCGEFVVMEQADVPLVRRAIANILEDRAYAGKCAQWSETVAARQYGGADLAARMISQMIAN